MPFYRTDDVLSSSISSAGVSRGIASVAGDYTYIKDGLGSIQAITTDSGSTVQRYIYSSFGKLLKTVDASGVQGGPLIKTSYTYTNRELDEESGLYYYRARYYDPHNGRFLQEDPHPGMIKAPTTINSSYIYALNNPLNRIDPTGMLSLKNFIKDLSIVVGAAFAGAAAGAAVGGAVGGPWGILVGAIVGSIVGAVTAIAINGAWNLAEIKKFFDGWENAAVKGAIAGAIAGGISAYGSIYGDAGASEGCGSKFSPLYAGAMFKAGVLGIGGALMYWGNDIIDILDNVQEGRSIFFDSDPSIYSGPAEDVPRLCSL